MGTLYIQCWIPNASKYTSKYNTNIDLIDFIEKSYVTVPDELKRGIIWTYFRKNDCAHKQNITFF